MKKRFLSIFLCLTLIVSVGMPELFVPKISAEENGNSLSDENDQPGEEVAMTPAEKAALLNAAELHVLRTGWEPLDTYVDQIFAEIFSDNMNTYQKTCAIFGFLMRDTSYVSGNETTDDAYLRVGGMFESSMDRNIVCEAYGMMKEKHGVCNDFSSAFTVLARAIGLEAYNITCTSFVPGYGTADHYTSAVRLNGELYVFDPVMGVVQNSTTEVETSKFFCMPLSSSTTREYCEFDEQLASFGGFKQGTPPEVPTEQIEDGISREVYYTIGSYPQTRVTDEALVSALNALLKENDWQSYGYYSGDGTPGSQVQSDYMRFADVEHQGQKYRAVTFSSYRAPFTYYTSDKKTAMQAPYGYKPGTVYWFRFEPIEWRLISSDNLLVSNIVLDSQAFNANVYPGAKKTIAGVPYYVFGDKAHTQPANDWGTSDIRTWLNGTFWDTAFTTAEKAQIADTQLKNIGVSGVFCYEDTVDRVFLLSRNDLRSSNYIYAESAEARLVTGSDYALSQGLSIRQTDSNKGATWLLRSAGSHSGDVAVSTNIGSLHFNISAAGTMTGIRPAIRIKNMQTLIPETITAPCELRATPTATGTISLKSAVSNDADGYCFTVYREGSDELLRTIDSSGPTTVVRGLISNNSYIFRVKAYRLQGGQKVFSDEVASPAVLCRTFVTAPNTMSASATASGEITVQWSPVQNAVSYRVYRFVDSDTLVLCGETEACSLAVPKLGSGYTFWFKVSSVSADGYESNVSASSVSCRSASIPSIPTGGIARATATREITLSWDPVPEAETYKVWRSIGNNEWIQLGETQDVQFVHNNGLGIGVTYYYRITAVCEGGAKESFAGKTFSETCASIPANPVNVTAAATATGAITFSWDAVAGAGSYRVYRYTSATEKTLLGETAGTSFTATGLSIGVTSSFCVTALTPGGTSESGVSATITAASESVPAIPTDLTVASTTSNALTVSWSAVPGAARYYVAQYGSDQVYHDLGSTETCAYTVSGLNVGSRYYFRVIAETADGGSQSKPAYVNALCESVPAKPVNVTAAATATGAITFSWDAVAGAGSYRVYRYTSATGKTLLGETAGTSFTATGLSVDVTYSFCVTALTQDKTSESSVSATITAASESVPAIPTDLAVSPSASDALTVSWSAVPGAARYYVAQYGSDKIYHDLGSTETCAYTVSGLNVGSRYYFRVIAETADGGSQSKPAFVNALCESVPAKPVNVTAAATATGAIKISWDAVPGAGFYRVFRYASASEKVLVGETAATVFTATDLSVGSTYSFCVTALTQDKTSESSVSATARATAESVPAIPTELAAAPTATGVLTVSWSAVPGAARYYVAQYGSDKIYHDLGSTETCVYTVSGLNIGSRYYFRVIAETADGGSQSKPAFVNALCEGVPAKPEGLSASTTAQGTITLSWTVVPGAGSYRVYKYTSATERMLLGEASGTSFTAAGLNVGSTYSFCVTAVTPDKTSESLVSATLKATCEQIAVTPDAPASLTASAAGDGEITLRWTKSTNATQYNIYQRSSDAQRYVYLATSYTDSYTVTGLSNGATWYYKVYPVNKGSAGTFTGESSPVASVVVLGTPAAPTALTAKATAEGEITLNWTKSAGATQYNVYRYRGDLKKYVYLGTSYTNSYAATGLSNGVTYYFKVLAATKGSGLTFVGPYSQAVSAKALGTPAAPTGLTAKVTAGGEITLNWTKSAGATQYNVYRYRGDLKKYVYLGTSYTNSYAATGLSNGVTYYFKVLAVTKGSGLTFVGPYSQAASAKALGTPAAPTGFTAKATGDGEITLNWTKSAGATQYNVYRYRGDVKQYVYIGTSNTNSYVATGLSNGVTYYFKVLAVTKGSGLTFVGPYSQAASAKALGTPAAPASLMAVNAGSGAIRLSWKASTGATQYNVYRYRGDIKSYAYVGTAGSTSYTVSGLTPGGTYYFKVLAVTKGNGLTFSGPYSQAANAKA